VQGHEVAEFELLGALPWIVEEDGTEHGINGRNALRYINHSATPNCAFNSDELTAIAPIARTGAHLPLRRGVGLMRREVESGRV